MRNALAVLTKRLDMELTSLQLQHWLDALFSDTPPPPEPAKPLAAILSETGPTAAIRGSHPRLETGAEPLWDIDKPTPVPSPPRPRIRTPATPSVVVSVHPKKEAERKEKARRGAVIAVSLVITLALAAAGYFLLL
jgi:hypothetical protein